MPICGTEAPAPQPEAQILPAVSDPFLRKLARGERVIAVELDSPRDADLTGYMASARRLQQAGVDALTIADCPIARARVDASLTACKLRRELGLVAHAPHDLPGPQPERHQSPPAGPVRRGGCGRCWPSPGTPSPPPSGTR